MALTTHRHGWMRFSSLISAITLTTLLLALVGGAGLLPSASATPVLHSSNRVFNANTHGAKRRGLDSGSDSPLEKYQGWDRVGNEVDDVLPPIIDLAKSSTSTVFGRLGGGIYLTASVHVDIPELGTRGANQSTKNMGADYVKLDQEFNGGYIVLSYIIAFVGSLCTLELLLRRTSNRGMYNVLLLLAAGVCFGSVSTFSMHFIGNNSLTLHHPREAELHIIPLFLTYDPAWTVLSLVVSCAVTILAFFVMGLEGDYVQDFFRKIGFVRWKQEDESASDEDDEDTQEARSAVVVTDLSVKEKKPPSKTLSWGNNAVHRQEAKMMDKSYDPSLRRASIAAIQPDIMREHFKPATVLSRIQSLPENYIDDSLIKGVPMEPIDGRTRSEQEHDMEGAIANIRRRISQTSQNSKENNPSKDEYVPSSRDSPDSSESSGRVRKRRHVRRRRMDDSGRTSKIKRHLGLDVVTMEDVMKIIISGAIAGIGIAGMHYIGQISINNIGIIRYRLITIVLSVLIACVAVIAGLYIMFIILRPKLKHGWVTKVGVACVLAAAVCAMHYTGMSGAEYGLWKGERPSGGFRFNTKRLIIGLVTALAFVACLSIFTFTIIARLRNAAHRRGRRRVVVATMIYDNENRLLVAPDGVIPMCDIAHVGSPSRKSSFGRSNSITTWDSASDISSVLDVDLAVSHPTFIAALRSTWAWRQPGVYPAGPGNALLRNQAPPSGSHGDANRASDDLSQIGSGSRRFSVLSTAESANYPAGLDSGRPLAMNVGRFLDRFQSAVAQLANTVIGHDQGVRRLGVLYDRILTTGHVKLSNGEGRRSTISNGQLIFLVRKVTTAHEKSQLLARNFLFADTSAVANVMADVLAVPVDKFADIIEDQRIFCDYGMIPASKPGKVYVAASIIQPTTFDGIQICVERHRRHQLPMRELCKVYPTSSAVRSYLSQSSTHTESGISGSIEEIGEALAGLEGQTLFEMIAPKNMLLEEEALIPEDPSTGKLRVAIVNQMIPMLDMLCTSKEMARILPRLQITPYLVPITPPVPVAIKAGVTQIPEIQSAAQMAWMIYFQAVLAADDHYPDLDWEPWTLFKAQSECVARDGRDGLQAVRNALLQSQAQLASTPARRPSRVQFSAFTIPSSHPASSVVEAPSILVNPENRDALQQFESFSFPAAPSASHSGDSRNASAHNVFEFGADSTMQKRTGPLTFDPFAQTSRGRMSHGGPDDLGILEMQVESTKNAVHGVGFYHQDWLSRLVREDMLHRFANTTSV